jgi:hypothetical protein
VDSSRSFTIAEIDLFLSAATELARLTVPLDNRVMVDSLSKPRRCFRFSLRTMFVLVTMCGIVLAYVASYYVCSRRGMREAHNLRLDGFLYVPWQDAADTQDLSRHQRLALFYAPLNVIDRSFFKGERPVRSITWELSEQ